MTDYPFHTDEIDGEVVVGVMFVPRNGRFYEFQDPETHDDYERFVDPRSGDVLTHDGPFGEVLSAALSGGMKALVPADKWADFRETYVDAPDDADRTWRNEWQRIHERSFASSGL